MLQDLRNNPDIQILEDADFVYEGKPAHRVVAIVRGIEVQIVQTRKDDPTLLVKVGNGIRLVHYSHIVEHLTRRLG